MKNKLWAVSILCTISLFGSAQTVSISGSVYSDDQKLPGAHILVEGTSKGATTDVNGSYRLELSPGSYHLICSFAGMRNQEILLKVAGENLEGVNFSLQPDNLNLNEVVVSGTRYEYDRSTAPVVVNVVDNKLLNATQSLTVAEGLNFQPGVRVETNCQNCGFTQVRLNGLQGAYSQILINSRPVFSALNSVYGLEQIPTNIIDRIEVVRSGGSALYGSNAIAGTINIITKDPVENTWEIKSNTALIAGEALDQSFNFNGSIVSQDYQSGVTFYGMSRNREAFDANGDGFTELVQLENNVLGAKAFFKPGTHSKISLDLSALTEYRRGGDRLNLAPHFTDITEELDHNTFFGGLNYELWNTDYKGKLTLYGSVQHTSRDSYYGGLGGGRTPQDSALAASAYGLTQDLAVAGGVQYNYYFTKDALTIGVENQFYDTRDEIQGYNRLVDQRVNTTGFFAQYEWKPSTKFTALMGARYDLSNVNGDYTVGDIQNTADVNIGVLSPRATLLYKINERFRLRGGYARGFRAPQAFNEDLHISSVGGEPLFVILSDDLDKETSDAFTASANYTQNFGSSQLNLLLEGFYTQLHNPFTQVSTGATLPNGSIVEEVRNGEGALVSGMNFEAGYSPNSDFSFQLGGTLQETRYSELQVLFEPEGTPADGEGTVEISSFVRNPNVYGYFNTFYELNKSLSFDFTGTYTGSMVVPRVVSETGFLDLVDTDPFLDLNLKANYRFNLTKGFQMELSGGVKNIFNSYQKEFDSGPERDSDFIYGPAAPRSVFLSIKFGSF